MPNDSTSQFPLPPRNASSIADASGAREVKLTDEVAPILSAPEPELQVRNLQSPVGSEPAYTPTAPPPAPIAPTPAARSEVEIPRIPAGPVPPNKSFPVVTLLLLLIAVGAIAATYFFYQQTLALNTQLTEITKTLEQQKIWENQSIPAPTPLPTSELEITQTPTPTSTISATVTPTVTLTPVSGKVFDQVAAVIETARKQYPSSQLIMIVVSAAENPDTSIIKYWFRQTVNDKKYLYVMREPGKDLTIVDQQVYVTPDNNIPSLNQMAENNGLGLDLDEAIRIAAAACPTNFDCVSTPISAQFIKANTTLWQISYRPTNGAKPFVVQIDSLSEKILYKSQ